MLLPWLLIIKVQPTRGAHNRTPLTLSPPDSQWPPACLLQGLLSPLPPFSCVLRLLSLCPLMVPRIASWVEKTVLFFTASPNLENQWDFINSISDLYTIDSWKWPWDIKAPCDGEAKVFPEEICFKSLGTRISPHLASPRCELNTLQPSWERAQLSLSRIQHSHQNL